MPIYEYQCETCDHKFEVQQKFSDPLVDACTKCGKSVRKLISAPGIVFKGTGWYVTDYSNKLKDPNLSKPSASAGGKQDSGATSSQSDGSSGDSSSSSTKAETSTTSSSSSDSSSSSAGTSSSSGSGSSSGSSSGSPAKPTASTPTPKAPSSHS